MPFNEEDDTYIPDFLNDIQEISLTPDLIAGLNDTQINESISIQT